MRKILEGILKRELDRLEERSLNESLDMEDLKKVEILTRSLKQIDSSEEQKDELDNLSINELLDIVKSSKETYERTDQY